MARGRKGLKIGRDGKGVREMSKKGREGGGRDGKGVVPLNMVGFDPPTLPFRPYNNLPPQNPIVKIRLWFQLYGN